jgi:hypothetical protein
MAAFLNSGLWPSGIAERGVAAKVVKIEIPLKIVGV